MTRYVYDFATHNPVLFITDSYVYGLEDQQAKFWIDDKYWYAYPTGAEPTHWQDKEYVYAFPSGLTPVFYVAK